MGRITNKAADGILDVKVPILDHGFVSLVDYMGGDQRIAEAAWVSTMDEVEVEKKSDKAIKRIINYMMDEFASAKKTIDIVVFLIGSKTVANALVKAKKRGIAIRMIIDAKVARSRYSKDNFLKKKGIEIKTVRVRGGSMHSKFILIDGAKIIAGSAAWCFLL